MPAAPSQACSEALIVISANIGLSTNKTFMLSELFKKEHCLCLQETHIFSNCTRPKITGMAFVAESPHNKYGSAVFVRKDLKVNSIYLYASREQLNSLRLRFIFKSLIGTDMTYHFSVDVPLRI